MDTNGINFESLDRHLAESYGEAVMARYITDRQDEGVILRFLAESHDEGVVARYLAEEARLNREGHAARARQRRTEIQRAVIAAGYPTFAGAGLALSWTAGGGHHD